VIKHARVGGFEEQASRTTATTTHHRRWQQPTGELDLQGSLPSHFPSHEGRKATLQIQFTSGLLLERRKKKERRQESHYGRKS
jgi:hypothetical protein